MEKYKKKKDYYLSLLNYSYLELVSVLLEKYGSAIYDYYSEYSYKRFFQGKVKTISTNSKVTRTDEGLYTHHIDENIYTNMSNISHVRGQKIPYSSQKKEKLVYCDIFEHLILHALISKETDLTFGIHGYEVYIKPQLCHWYIYGKKFDYQYGKPNRHWLNSVYLTAFMPVNYSLEVVNFVDKFVYGNSQNLSEYEFNNLERHEIYLQIREQRKEELEQERIRKEEEYHNSDEYKKILIQLDIDNKIAEDKRIEDFYKSYPNLGKHNIPIFTGNRKEALKILWDLKYHSMFKSKKELNSYKINSFSEELIDEVHEIQENLYK